MGIHIDLTPGFNLHSYVGGGIPFISKGNGTSGKSTGTGTDAGDQAVAAAKNTTTPSNTSVKDAGDSPADLGAAAGSGGTTLSASDQAYLDTQIGLLQGLLGKDSTTLSQGEDNLNDSYNSSVNSANTDRTRALEDYDTQDQQNNQQKTDTLGGIDTASRVLNDSLKRILGMAGGSNSSAYQITAPNAVARQASTQRNGALQTFTNNESAVKTARDRATSDFASLLSDLSTQKAQKEEQLKTGVLQNDQDVNKQIASLVAQKASGSGGGYAGAIAAQQPYTNAINSSQSSIDSLFDQFRNPVFQTTAVTPDAVNLDSYTANAAAIDPNSNGATMDPSQTSDYYLANLKKKDTATA